MKKYRLLKDMPGEGGAIKAGEILIEDDGGLCFSTL